MISVGHIRNSGGFEVAGAVNCVLGGSGCRGVELCGHVLTSNITRFFVLVNARGAA